VKKQVVVSLCVVAALLGAAGLAGAVPRQSDAESRHHFGGGATLLQPRLRDGGTLAQAGAPTIVSYQGQVSLDGRPFDGMGYFKFAIVDPSVPETFWSNDGSSDGGGEPELPVRLMVTAGLFNVLLGDPSVENMDQPLEAAVFAEQEECYLRVWFSEGGETFQQLSPDRRIASVPYALQAEEAANANTLGGRLPGNASGRIPINNGTVSSNLNADLLDGMQGADLEESVEIDADITTHAADAEAHHARYTNAEALGAVLDNDGAGSGLDADTVDGQHASDLAVPSGAMVLGLPNDSGLIDAGYSDVGPSNVIMAYWLSTSTTNVPSARGWHSAVWTGSEMIIWGGVATSGYLNTGGRYNPASDTWAPITTTNAPSARFLHTAVWAGSEMLVWGGSCGADCYFNTGGRYDPATDTWTTITPTGAPSARYQHPAVWTGSEMIVWGGRGTSPTYKNDGGRYDPATDTWTAMSTTNVPSARGRPTAVWTGSEMIVWGGYDASPTCKRDGGRYDPATDTWTPTTTSGAPAGRYRHTAVWTGSEMLVWGGWDGGWLNSGGRYDPPTDTWTAMTTGAPSARDYHTAVWTGSEMWVWGGRASSGDLNDGGQYNPSTDSWRGMTTADAPSPRDEHTAVWNGIEMLVWGGEGSSPNYKNDGGRYRCTPVLHLYWKS
jgi:N-acetylneuraminic acid mutarotase